MKSSVLFKAGAFACAAFILVALPVPGHSQTPAAPQTSNIAGNWTGTLSFGQSKIEVVLNLTQPAAGPIAGWLDLPSAGASDLPVEKLTYADHILSFDVNVGAPSHYEGVVSRDNTELIGHFQQGGNAIPLAFTHTGAKADANTPRATISSEARRKIPLQPCAEPGVTKDALCGQYEVFEDRAKNAGRKIRLNVMVLPALVDKPASDPIFYFAGGPGGAASSYGAASFITQMHRLRDVVLVDQRGTGKSNPLQCNFHGDTNDMSSYFVENMTPEAARACRAELEKNADLRLYTTTLAMADLDEVRTQLGYDKINVYGGSYGSTAALAYLKFYPQHVRTVALAHVAPPDLVLPLSFAAGVEHAINRLIDDCGAEEKCHATFPQLRTDWNQVVANVEKGPVTFDTLNPVTRQKQQITMTRDGFTELMRLVLYIPNVMSILPLMIHQMSQGDYSQFAYYSYQVRRGVDAALARGMQLSVLCAEDIPFLKESDIQSKMAGTFYGVARAHLYQKLCEQWPRGEMPAKYREPINSDVPVLIISGDLDPVTPPSVATPLLRGFPNGRQIIMPNATHNSYECAERLALEFIERGSAKDLDASCAPQVKRLPFLTALPPLAIPK
jgi:pimeloyl-ACP methyl ester carboxylesterase